MSTPIEEPSEFLKQYYKEQEERKKALPAKAAELRQKLLTLGVTSVAADYDGAGDSGQMNGVSWEPQTLQLPPGTEGDIEALFWDFLEAHHAGWENNDGGRGDFRWDITTGNFTLDHEDYYTESNATKHEGWGK